MYALATGRRSLDHVIERKRSLAVRTCVASAFANEGGEDDAGRKAYPQASDRNKHAVILLSRRALEEE